jgi:hypothetical protein
MPLFGKKSDCEAQLAVSLQNFEKLQKEHEKLMDDYIALKGKSLGNASPSDSDLEAELNALKLDGGRKRKTRSRKSRGKKTLKQRK